MDPNADYAALHAAAALREAGDCEHLDAAAGVVDARADGSVVRILSAAREHLEMDVAYFSHFGSADQVVQGSEGDRASFGLVPGRTIALIDSYCQRMLDGRVANIVADPRNDEQVMLLASTIDSDIGAYIGVPVSFSDGYLYGTLACARHAPAPWLGKRDVSFMHVLARLLAEQLERQEVASERERYRTEAVALNALVAALDARDSYSGRHSNAVVELAEQVAEELGLPQSSMGEIKHVALLHDIGKIGIPDSILVKPGPLSDAEWELMRSHSIIGAEIVASIASIAHLAAAIRAEHERWDGMGYPDGLVREQIPLASRIALACDAYDAMTSDRPYRDQLEPEYARRELAEHAGAQFDADVVAALLRVLGR
ncbi:MAG: hypothetical protein QOD83_3592 [Solirubrobacteraceae bacterium]|jgi:putative nucleotidyltransferase with HDIG domain|nr:hypothetical protein [Solirubrobacteraceae bacterium]